MKKAVLLLSALLIAGCSTTANVVAPAEKFTVQIDGSSTVFPITEAMAEEFQKTHPNVNVVAGIAGTGGGFKRFCRGETHINDASRPIKEAEVTLCQEGGVEYIELPVAYDGLAVMVHPGNDWVDYLTVAELKKIWEPEAQGKIVTWKQVRSSWPDTPISLYGPGVDSGTYDYFTEAIVGKEGSSRGDFVASEDDNTLVQGIATDPNALGFFGFAYYQENADKLKLVPVTNKEGGTLADALLPSVETINNGTYKPLSRPLFLYVSTKAVDEKAVADFINFYIDPANADTLVSEVGYVPFAKELYALVSRRFDGKVTGSMYTVKTGKTVEQLLQGEAQ